MIRERISGMRNSWQGASRGRSWLVFAVIIAFVAVAAARYFTAVPSEEAPIERQLPVVRLEPLNQLVSESSVSYQAPVEPASVATLVTRTGGRVTAVRHQLGEQVRAGEVVVEIDGRGEANLGRVQVATLSESLRIFDESERVALVAADIAVTLAEQNLRLARATGPLNTEAGVVAREQADVAARGAELALEDARATGVDQAIRAADIALKNAGFAQDQATINRELSRRQQTISLEQARLNVESARAGKANTTAQLASQRQGLTGQMAAAQEQLKLQQIAAPLSGEITQLAVHVGDYLQPGTAVGEVNALAGARMELSVPSGVQARLAVGQEVPLERGAMRFMGQVSDISSAPAAETGLWQVDILITATPEVLHPAEIVTARLPVGAVHDGTYFLPLRALAIRQDGAALFTVDGERRARVHAAHVVAFHGSFVEVTTDLASDALIVVEGNRTIAEGDEVTVAE